MNESKTARWRRREQRLLVLRALAVCVLLLWAATVPDWAWLVTSTLPPLLTRISASEAVASALADALVFTVLVAIVALGTVTVATRRMVRREGSKGESVSATDARGHVRRLLAGWAAALPLCLLFQHLSRVAPLVVVPVGAVAAAVVLVLALVLAPWLLTWSPRVSPLRDEALAGRLHGLASRAGLRVAGMHEWKMDSSGVEPNAALVGLGFGRRLLLSTALVERLGADELDVVVGHELGHHAHGHTWRRIGLALVLVTVALGGAQLACGVAGWWLGLRQGDAALIPWAALGAGAVWIGSRPRWLAQSRAHEHDADHFSLELTRRPDVLEAILRRLSAEGHDLDAPTWFDQAFFLTHPPAAERVMRARAWQCAPDGRQARDDRMATS